MTWMMRLMKSSLTPTFRRARNPRFCLHMARRMTSFGTVAWTLPAAVLVAFVSLEPATAAIAQLNPDWSRIPYLPLPVRPAGVTNPVLTGSGLGDSIQFVGDPFLYRENDTWYLFFEAYIKEGRIGVAESQDGLHWRFRRLLDLDPVPVHHSFPFIFSDGGDHYLMPESGALQEVRLYKATSFPDSWGYAATLVSGAPFVDPVLVRFQDTWWLFVSHSGSQSCFLYFSDSLTSGWREHPMSPVVRNDRSRARPAGRFPVLADNVVIRLAQRCDSIYGQSVRAFEIDTLTRTRYAEHELPESPILRNSGHGWNADGMHQFSPWWDTDHWLVAVDGDSALTWSIAMYETPRLPLPGPGAGPRAVVLSPCFPNPSAGSTEIPFAILPGARGRPVRLDVCDPLGRLVRNLADQLFPPGARQIAWDGSDRNGRRVPSGEYYIRLRCGEESQTRKAIRAR